MNRTDCDIEATLRSTNRRLSTLLNRPELTLSAGGAHALQDPLWVWGVLGGKDVGKSTLINALAGGEVVPQDERIGEGTFRPAAYLCAGDTTALRRRFLPLDDLSIDYRDIAPEGLRGLALIDLPDFDSLFSAHVAQVRRVAALLDGIIWVTTPKKVGDLRAGHEIQRVLKDRVNFVYVVNKIDWLLAQSTASPAEEMGRLSAAVRAQIHDCDDSPADDRVFPVAAKYRTLESTLDAVARSRNLPNAKALKDAHPPIAQAAQGLVANFAALRTRLTTPPTDHAAATHKRANLVYQVRTQAGHLLNHYQPHLVLDRLERAADPEEVRNAVARALPDVYCTQLVQTLNSDQRLFPEWSAALFTRRVARWPLLGIVAWPLTLIGAMLGGLRHLLPGAQPGPDGDPFRFDGITLEDRVRSVDDRLRTRLAGVTRDIPIDLVAPAELARQFRHDVHAVVEQQRAVFFEPLLAKRPTLIGRALRWFFPFAVLLWFPLVQPILAGVLALAGRQSVIDVEVLATLVRALSAGNVLQGLCVSLLILAGTVAAIYSVAARDAYAALQGIRDAAPGVVAGPLWESLTRTVTHPIDDVRAELAAIVDTLRHLANGHAELAIVGQVEHSVARPAESVPRA